MFFSLDGVDGAGKTTQVQRFCQWLVEQGHDVTACRDPGGTPLGERIRDLLLDTETGIGDAAETLLYMAARAQLVDQVICPALDAERIVVSDRFVLSNIAYQGYAGHLAVETIRFAARLSTRGVEPELTFVLDVDPELAAARRTRPPDRLERRGPEFQRRVRQGFLAEAQSDPQRIVIIDASRPIDQVHQQICEIAAKWLTERHAK